MGPEPRSFFVPAARAHKARKRTSRPANRSAPPKKHGSHAVARRPPPPKRTVPPKSSTQPPPNARAPTAPHPSAPVEPVIPALVDGRRHVLSLSFLRDGDEFLARLETDAGQITELKNRSLDQLLTLVAGELEDLLE